MRGYGVGCGDEANDVTKGGGANDLYWIQRGERERGGASRCGRGFDPWAWLHGVGVALSGGRGFGSGRGFRSRRGFGKWAWLRRGVASHSRCGFRRGGGVASEVGVASGGGRVPAQDVDPPRFVAHSQSGRGVGRGAWPRRHGGDGGGATVVGELRDWGRGAWLSGDTPISGPPGPARPRSPAHRSADHWGPWGQLGATGGQWGLQEGNGGQPAGPHEAPPTAL